MHRARRTLTQAPLLGALLLPLTLAGGAWAGAPGMGEGGGHRGAHGRRPPFERVIERHAERLGLDAATREAIEAIAAEDRADSEALHERVRTLRGELHELLRQDPPDEATVMRAAERVGAADTELQKHRLRSMLRIRALLTPEQRAELVRIHGERRRERGSHRGEAPVPDAEP